MNCGSTVFMGSSVPLVWKWGPMGGGGRGLGAEEVSKHVLFLVVSESCKGRGILWHKRRGEV